MTDVQVKSQSNRAAVVFSVVAALVAGWVLYGWVYRQTQTGPWGSGVVIGAGIAIGAGVFKWQDRRLARAIRAEERRLRDRGESAVIWSDDPRYKPDRSWVAPVAILAVFAGYGFV